MQKAKVIEELDNFPFKNFQEFKKAEEKKIVVGIGIDWGISLQRSFGGIHCPKSLKYFSIIFSIIPILSAIGLVVFAIITKNWRLLLGLPLLGISFVVSHPNLSLKFNKIVSIGLFVAFIYSFWSEKYWLSALATSLLLIWQSRIIHYETAFKTITATAILHEDLLCILWNCGSSIAFSNGDRYWKDFKIEDGKYIHYKKTV